LAAGSVIVRLIVKLDELPTGAHEHHSDYLRIAAAIDYIRTCSTGQPSLQEVSEAVGSSEFHLQRLFTRWAGISPKRFLQLLTLQHAKRLLQDSENLLSTTYETGLSSPGRLHDLFVTLEAVTPGEFKSRGQGLVIRYGFSETPFGECLLGETSRGICFLEFVANETHSAKLDRLKNHWQEAAFVEDRDAIRDRVEFIFSRSGKTAGTLNLLVKGTNFQVQVWQALLRIPRGSVTCYAKIADWIGRPNANRAVGSAVGANPIAWLIPCHRVLPADGHLGGYHWGETRKCACLVWEQSG
jgi:AraC family transcriptional regulator of adaptative response/methylated-DNA-[protein]-cysteine methyltransferase